MKFGLIGQSLKHSFSKQYFSEKFEKENIDAVYELFELNEISDFPSLLTAHPDLKGLNVTIPYKTSILSYLDAIDEEAAAIGAVNTISIKNKKLTGYNTDSAAFEATLLPLLNKRHTHALISGTGGAAKAVEYILKKHKIEVKKISRTRNAEDIITYDELNEKILLRHLLIINTTPAGMYPDIDEAPAIPYRFITKDHLLYDLIYNPEMTLFLKYGQQQGAQIKNGLEMLYLQAEKAWQIWND